MKDATCRAILIVIGLAFMLALSLGTSHLWLAGKNDFAPFYVGTKLVGTHDLYSVEPYYAFLSQKFQGMNESLRYTRPPHHAALFWLLGRLPYDTAYLVWTLLRLAAIAGFLMLWRWPTQADAAVFAAWFLPLFVSLYNGQDTPFLLLWIALAMHWHSQGRPFLAGLIFSLCAAKFHLLLLLPLLLLGQRRWRMTAGLATGAAALLAISFAVAGARWPLEYFATLTDGRVHPGPEHMPNFHGMFAGLPYASWLEILASAAVVAGTWYVVRRSDFEVALSAVLAGGVLLSYHAYLADCTILLPAALLVISVNPSGIARFFGLLLLTPPLYLALGSYGSISHVSQAAILLFFGALVVTTGRQPAAAPATAGAELAPAQS